MTMDAPIGVRLTPHERELIKMLARHEHRSVAGFVRKIILDYLELRAVMPVRIEDKDDGTGETS